MSWLFNIDVANPDLWELLFAYPGMLLLWAGVSGLVFICIHVLVRASWSVEWMPVALRVSKLIRLAVPVLILSYYFKNEGGTGISSFSSIFWCDVALLLILLFFQNLINNRFKQVGGNKKLYALSAIFLVFVLFFSVMLTSDYFFISEHQTIHDILPYYLLVSGMQMSFAIILVMQRSFDKKFEKYYRQYVNLLAWLWFYFLFSWILITWYGGIPNEDALLKYLFTPSGAGLLLFLLITDFLFPVSINFIPKNRMAFLKIVSYVILLGKLVEFAIIMLAMG